jgi:putative addiction module component (TIGR02574 family)
MDTLDIAGLTSQERLELISRLWDSLDHEPPLTAAQASELDRRIAAADQPGIRDWSELRAELTIRR